MFCHGGNPHPGDTVNTVQIVTQAPRGKTDYCRNDISQLLEAALSLQEIIILPQKVTTAERSLHIQHFHTAERSPHIQHFQQNVGCGPAVIPVEDQQVKASSSIV